jgi:serine/threonine protein kinase
MFKFSFQKKQSAKSVKKPSMRDMKPIDVSSIVNCGQIPPPEIDQLFNEINEIIQKYNQSTSVKRFTMLQEIRTRILQFESTYPDSYLASAKDYQTIQANLFQEIKYQCDSMGVSTLTDLQEKTEINHSPIAEIIANMSPDKLSRLLIILNKGEEAQLSSALKFLYGKNDSSQEAQAFRKFLKTHELSYLGGGNSHNFKVKGLNDDSIVVLRVDNRLGSPRGAEIYLREQLKDKFTGIDAARVAFAFDLCSEEDIARTLLVTEFCTGGSLSEFSHTKSTQKLLNASGNIFEQMASTFIDIEKAGCMFPDAKLGNWLLDSKGNLRIVDAKSFLYIKEGIFNKSVSKKNFYSLKCTRGLIPKEFSLESFNADKAHSYLLGKNLYQYATGTCSRKHEGKLFNFNYSFFKTAQGAQYQKLIEDLVRPEPENRISVSTALERLKTMNQLFTLCDTLEQLKFGKKDTQMESYILKKQREYHEANTPEKRQAISEEMQKMATSLKTSEVLEDLRSLTSHFREKSTFFSIGKNSKANRIEQAIAHMTLDERCNFFQSGKHTKDVLEALASCRSIINDGKVHRTAKGTLDESKAALSFKLFKQKYEKQLEPTQMASEIKDSVSKNLG